MAGTDKEKKASRGLSRRRTLALMAAAGGTLAAARPGIAQVAAPAVRKKVKLTYWNWADNPVHQKISTDSVDMFNKSQNLIEVEVDATMAVMESRKKLVVAHAAGAPPDVIMTVQYWVQDYFDNGILHPIEDYFKKWDQAPDFFPNVIEQTRSKAGQPIMFVPQTSIPYFLFYRADWLKEANVGVPDTFDQFVAAAKAITKAPDRYGIAMRGQTYSAIQVILPIWFSAGVKFADAKGNVDFDSAAAIDVTEKWVGMFTKDKSAQPSAVNDGYREQYALMEKSKCGLWFYGPHASPAMMQALGDAIQPAANPRVGPNKYMLANPEGPMMTTGCKEREAAWEFIKFITSGDALLLYTAGRAVPPVRKTTSLNPVFQNNRFIKFGLDEVQTWWTPPYEFKNWANFQDKIPPFWQEVLSQKITPKQFNEQGAKFLRGQA
ncbi:MAG: extracellular solute-binding protein [Alphaproteobacteria bacterium]|nr:extracellular solute-binding protein [Alphaproteobacteria bacterium]